MQTLQASEIPPVGTNILLIFYTGGQRPVIFRALGWIVLGTCISVVMAEDTERMVSYLTPFVFLATAFLVDQAESVALDVLLVVLAVAHLLIMLATVPFPVHPHGLVTSSLRLELLVVSCAAVAAGMAVGMRRSRVKE